MRGIGRVTPMIWGVTHAEASDKLPCGFCGGEGIRGLVGVVSREYGPSDVGGKCVRVRPKKKPLYHVSRGICTDCYTTLGYANREANRRAAAANKKAKSRRKRALVKDQKRRVR